MPCGQLHKEIAMGGLFEKDHALEGEIILSRPQISGIGALDVPILR